MKSVVDMVAETFEMPLLPRFSVDQIPDRDWVAPSLFAPVPTETDLHILLVYVFSRDSLSTKSPTATGSYLEGGFHAMVQPF